MEAADAAYLITFEAKRLRLLNQIRFIMILTR